MKRILPFLLIFTFVFSALLPILANASPGGLDKNGGHTCRTNCAKYGLKTGQYHYHNGTATPAPKPTPAPQPVPVPKPVPQAPPITIYINGVKQTYDQAPIIENGRLLVPLRGIFESLGATVEWNNQQQLITANRNNTKVLLKVGSKAATVNGQTQTLDVAAKIANGRTLVPLRFVGEALGASVEYDNANRLVKITSNTNITQSLNGDLKVSFIDVGQGDSVLIQTPAGKSILIDGGIQAAGEKVVSYLAKAGVTTIDMAVATHPDADHIGGLIHVLKNVNVNKVLDSGKTHTTKTYLEYLRVVDQRNIPFEVATAGSFINIDKNVKIQVLNSTHTSSDTNESSIVLKVTYGNISYLLTGDATINNEQEMIKKFNVSADILQAGHHGSNTSTSQAFVNAVKPKVAIISYGQGNQYGHPTDAVVNRLKASGAAIYGTANYGNIVVKTDGKTYQVIPNQ